MLAEWVDWWVEWIDRHTFDVRRSVSVTETGEYYHGCTAKSKWSVIQPLSSHSTSLSLFLVCRVTQDDAVRLVKEGKARASKSGAHGVTGSGVVV